MNDQIGWRGLLERLQKEAPRYVQLLPELPRLAHQALQPRSRSNELLLEALLIEQRRTNRLLQGIAFGVIGFVIGLVVTGAVVRWGW
jgi:ubiquinone biosynthesis protein